MRNPIRFDVFPQGPFVWRVLVLAVCAYAFVGLSCAQAQPAQPLIKYVFPQGAQRGTTVEAVVSGANLQDASGVRITGGGVTGSVAKVDNANTAHISVVVAPDAVLGERDLRLITPGGASNRFRFFIGQFVEVNEKEPNSVADQAQQLESLPVLINGQTMPTDRDFFKFAAKAGQTLVCEVFARKLYPYIADAVPGWLESCLTLYDSNGKELKYVDDFRTNPDAVLVYNVPKDGEYLLEMRDLIYRGRPDFIYRLNIGAFPFITDIFPLGWQRNSEAQVTVHGVNLPAQSIKLAIANNDPPVRFLQLSLNGLSSNPVPFAVGDTQQVSETEPNNAIDQANKVGVPATINGRIQQRGDTDHFAFAAKKGQRLILQVQARRLDSPLDSIIHLLNASGQELREQDDTDMGEPFLTHHADSRIDYTFPADGDYVVQIADVEGHGGEEYAYRILIGPPQPDYLLRMIPDNPRVGEGGTTVIRVNALRKDGFNGEINLAVQGLPNGFVASHGMIPAGQTEVRLTFTAPAGAPVGLFSPGIQGTATIAEKPAVRQGVPTADIMQAFSLKHLVPTREFLLSVVDTPFFALSSNISPTQVREVRQESQLQIVVKASRKGIQNALAKAEAEKKAAEQTLAKVKADLAKAKTGYTAAEAAAKAAETAAANAKTAAAKAAAAHVAAGKTAAAKRQQAAGAKKKLDDLVGKQQKPAETKLAAAAKAVTDAKNAKAPANKLAQVEAQRKAAEQALTNVKNQVAAATKAYQAAEKAAKDAETAAATAQAAADKARTDQAAAEKVAPEKRKLANAAKAKQDKLVADEKAANTALPAAAKKLEAAKKVAKEAITLLADAPPRGITVKSVALPADKNEIALTIAVSKQAPVGLTQNILISGGVKIGNETVTHFAPAIPIKVLVSAKTLATAAAAKRKQANDAKKKLDDLVGKQQKPAETKLAAAAKAVTTATTAKAAVDKALAAAKAATAKAKQAYEAAAKAAKEAEAKSNAISKDAGKSPDEKKKATADAAAKRKATDAAKAVLAQAQKTEQQAQTQVNTATQNLTKAEAQKKAAEQALANVKNQVAAATKAYQAADKAATDAETEAAKAKA